MKKTLTTTLFEWGLQMLVFTFGVVVLLWLFGLGPFGEQSMIAKTMPVNTTGTVTMQTDPTTSGQVQIDNLTAKLDALTSAVARIEARLDRLPPPAPQVVIFPAEDEDQYTTNALRVTPGGPATPSPVEFAPRVLVPDPTTFKYWLPDREKWQVEGEGE